MTKKSPKRPPGRHRLPAAQRRTEPLNLKVSQGEKDLVFKAALSLDAKPYEWARRMILHAAKVQLGIIKPPTEK